jgi:hypothetical protein
MRHIAKIRDGGTAGALTSQEGATGTVGGRYSINPGPLNAQAVDDRQT